MTAYGAMHSLMNTINNVLISPRFSLVGLSKQIIKLVYNKLQPWKKVLEILDSTSPSRSRKKVNALDGTIKEAIWEFEDSLESLLGQQITPQLGILPEIVFIDLQSLQNDAHSLIQTLKSMKKAYVYEVENMPQDESISSLIGFHGASSKMIGLSDQFQLLKTDLTREELGTRHVYALCGTAGVGKTTLAMQIYQDPQIRSKYECRAWLTVGRVPQPTTQISRAILAQLSGIKGDGEIGDGFTQRLDGKNCLIVLDDVWEEKVLVSLLKTIGDLTSSFDFLLTGRQHKTMRDFTSFYYPWLSGCTYYVVRFLNEGESMELLCEKVFGDEGCPPQLHKAAIKIAKLCEGLPLMIVTVADILSKSERNRDPAYWNEVAEKRNSVFTDAYNEISKVLFPSYDYLPQHLKMPFLFMGVFPSDYDAPRSKIMLMLEAEGLWYDSGCLKELAFYYWLVLRTLKSVDKNCDFEEFNVSEYKTCRLHSSWRYVCRVEASKNKLYHVLHKLIDAEEGRLEGQRGLCIENNNLFGIKEFCDSVRFNCASSTRSLLFYGPYHRYPIPMDVGFTLLREIDALTQRFYTFSVEILSLVQLKYLALTCNGEIPPTISKLFNLRVLIIHPHVNIRHCKAPSYAPMQMWDMQELEHIEILGKSLVAPPPWNVASMEKLSTLVGVNASISTILELSKRVPNIKKLEIQIELTPHDDHSNLLSCFGCISTLTSLKTLKFSITNPVIKRGHGESFPVTPESLKLPPYLRKLHLSGMGFPWEYTDAIGTLLTLKVLKLRSYAFQGSHWKTRRIAFRVSSFFSLKKAIWHDGDRETEASLGLNT